MPRRWVRRNETGEQPQPEETIESPSFGITMRPAIKELLPGFVHLPKVLPLALQQQLLDTACLVTAPQSGCSGGWYRFESGSTLPRLNDGNKARFWDVIEKFPDDFGGLGKQLAELAAVSPDLAQPAADFQPRVGALNFYTGKGRMNWHKDDYNFAKKARPIVMACLGDTAEFGYKMRASDPDASVYLESGDVIVFGGPARDLVHALLRVLPRSTPPELRFPSMPGSGRVSITWRDVGPEDGLVFNSDQRLGLTVTEHTLPRYRPHQKGM